ncbi:hypothetical protein DFH09DRAFT_1275278 [Mycena vulgaris]|nr:hypothetical protein DFH09DRAFT_1275278 [Mycena vulgaris]
MVQTWFKISSSEMELERDRDPSCQSPDPCQEISSLLDPPRVASDGDDAIAPSKDARWEPSRMLYGGPPSWCYEHGDSTPGFSEPCEIAIKYDDVAPVLAARPSRPVAPTAQAPPGGAQAPPAAPAAPANTVDLRASLTVLGILPHRSATTHRPRRREGAPVDTKIKRGKTPSSTSTNYVQKIIWPAVHSFYRSNYINFCALTLAKTPLTNGGQIETGSCNPTPIGLIPSVDKMPSAKFTFPVNFGGAAANVPFIAVLQTKNLATGTLTNAKKTYFTAPQKLTAGGIIIGHRHIVIKTLIALDQSLPLDPKGFFYFKGVDDAGVNGLQSVLVTNGVPPGAYRMCSINSSIPLRVYNANRLIILPKETVKNRAQGGSNVENGQKVIKKEKKKKVLAPQVPQRAVMEKPANEPKPASTELSKKKGETWSSLIIGFR